MASELVLLHLLAGHFASALDKALSILSQSGLSSTCFGTNLPGMAQTPLEAFSFSRYLFQELEFQKSNKIVVDPKLLCFDYVLLPTATLKCCKAR